MMPARVSEPQAAALRWMDGLLRGCGIPYQMTGDVAVVAHGAARPVRDIELFVAAEHVPALLLAAREHVVDYPWRRLDDRWDLVALVLEHDGVRIDVRIADAARCRDAATGAWRFLLRGGGRPGGVRYAAGRRRRSVCDAAKAAT